MARVTISCVDNCNDSMVHLSQGNPMLCDACKFYQFPGTVLAGVKNDVRKSNRITSVNPFHKKLEVLGNL